MRDDGEIRVPLVSEKARVEKSVTCVGELRIHKTVTVEMRTITVAVRTEEVRIERVDLPGGAPAPPRDGAATLLEIPLMEERIEVRKVPFVREVLRIVKDRHKATIPVETSVRREDAQIRRE
jgi:uncharacterized protein (TIGR02271 family)